MLNIFCVYEIPGQGWNMHIELPLPALYLVVYISAGIYIEGILGILAVYSNPVIVSEHK